MEYRTLDINVVSAKGIKQVNFFSKMDVYVVVSITGDNSNQRQSTPVSKKGHRKPSWNFPMRFNVDAQAADHNRLTLVFELRCEGFFGDKDIGEVHVPIKELLEGQGNDKNMQFVTYQVRKPSGKPKGEFHFSFKFNENNNASDEGVKIDDVVTAYPAVGSSSGYPPPAPQQPYMAPPGGYPGYPPGAQQYQGYPPQQYGGYPHQGPPPGYGYPPQQGYGYPPQQVQQAPKKKSKFGGLGLGAGLLGGALGGLLIGDMVSDGFDGGFDC